MDLGAFFDTDSLHIPYFREIFAILAASLIIVPLFQRLKSSPVLGYLVTGMIIGPFGLALVAQTPGLDTLSDLGVVFLLFIVGLKMSIERLRAMRRYVFGLGILQVLITGSLIAGIAKIWGNSTQVSLLLGFCFALSSTAVVSQMLMERDELLTHKGRVTLSILLAQDLAVVPLLVLVKVFSEGSGDVTAELGVAALKAAGAIAFIIAAGRLCLRPLFRMVNAASQSPELFVALSLLIVLATAALTSTAGLSMELGAFMAGLLLAETEFHNRIENDIRPFQGLLLGLFFITVGMGIDVQTVASNLFWLGASVVGLCMIKIGIIAILVKIFRVEREVGIPSAILLGESGEFLFVVVGSAMVTGLMPQETGHFMMLVTALSILATPLLFKLSQKAEARLKPV